jgi:hypothetical protein
MNKTRFTTACMTLLLCPLLTGAAQNESGVTLKHNNFYLGGGLGFNSLPGFGNAVGAQLLAGYEFDARIIGGISTGIELGLMDSGDFDRFNGPGTVDGASGVWLNVVESVSMNSKFDMLVRAGLDMGDDDGLMVGAGIGYKFNNRTSWRTEYVVRDHIDSFQFNIIFRL